MPLTDLLRATVMLNLGAAAALAAVTLFGALNVDDRLVIYVAGGWWVVAAIGGLIYGRGGEVAEGIGRMLANANVAHALPEPRPGRTLLNRLWPLLVVTVVACALAWILPQVPGMAAGFAILWALAWRNQEAAVTAIEDRDGARFYVEQTSPWSSTKVMRTVGLKREQP
jgi:hypothetical protein